MTRAQAMRNDCSHWTAARLPCEDSGMVRLITKATSLAVIRLMLFTDGYEFLVPLAAGVKDAAVAGGISWTKDRLRVTRGMYVDAQPYERARNALIVKAVQDGKANDAAKRALRSAGIAAATVREAMVLRKPR